MTKQYLSSILLKLGIEDPSIIRIYLQLSIGLVITSIITLVSINITNRFLSPTELGIFSYNKSLLEIGFGILSLNIYSSYLRFNLKGDNIYLKNFVQKITIISSVIFGVYIYIVTKSILCLTFIFIIPYNERMYFYRSLLEIGRLNSIQIIAASITLGSILLNQLFCITPTNSNSIIFCYGLGYLLVIFSKRPVTIIDNEVIQIKKILLICVPTVGLVIVDWVLNLSSNIFIKEFFDYNELANYAIAQRALIFLKFITATFLMFYPMIYFRAIENKQKNKIDKSRKLILLLLLIMLIVLFISAKYLYLLLGAKIYLETNSLIIFRILLLAEFFRVSSSFFGLFLTYSLQTFKNLFILSAGSILNVILQFLFLRKYGIMFSAISTLISSVLIFILMIIFSYKKEIQFLDEKLLTK